MPLVSCMDATIRANRARAHCCERVGSFAATITGVSVSESDYRSRSFSLTRRQRVQWAVGSKLRAVAMVGAVAVFGWLGFVSIGLSAVVVILGMVFVGHWVPYLLAGRSRLSASPQGITDHLRFRTRSYRAEEVERLHTVKLGSASYGLAVDLRGSHPTTEFLRSTWRPSQHEAEQLLEAIQLTLDVRRRPPVGNKT